MARRVVLGALPGGGQGLRVSRPGFDVLDTGLTAKQLAFDSRWPSAARVHMEGQIFCGAVGNVSTYSTVNFGVDFGVPPPVITLVNNGPGWQPSDYNYANGNWPPTDTGIDAVRVYSSFIQFWHPLTGLPGRTYKYIVLRPF